MNKKFKYFLITFGFILILIPLIAFSINNNLQSKYVSSENKTIVPIFMYHEVKTYKLGKDVISPYEFESDLKFLEKNHYNTITMKQLIDYVYNNAELPPNPIILSFDDGYLNNYKYVFPLLTKYKMHIVFSIIGKNSDDFTRIPDNNLDYSHVNWAQLSEMYKSGYVEIQNHSYNLHRIRKGRYGCKEKFNEPLIDYEKVLTEDITPLQNKISFVTGETPTTFAYPYGSYSKNTDTVLKKLGFKATLSCKYGINVITRGPDCLFRLKRICRSHNRGIEKALKKAMKTLK